MTGFRHVVLIAVKDDTTEDQIDEILDRLRELPSAIPEIVSYVVGGDAGLAADNAAIAVVADFASRDDYVVYRDHPAHLAVISNYIKPVIAGRTAVQHEVTS